MRIYFYFLATKIVIIKFFKKIYFSTSYYNKFLQSRIPERFHYYPNTKICKTKAGNSIIISLSNGEGWLLENKMDNFDIEKNIFLGNKNKIINSESVSISGKINKEIISIEWEIKKIN